MASAFRTAFTHPFRTYFKVGSAAFGFTFAGNLAWTALGREHPINPTTEPELYAAALLTKSAYAGLLWPAIPFRIYQSPRRFFCVGGGIADLMGYMPSNDPEEWAKKFNKSSLAKHIEEGLENGNIKIKFNEELINDKILAEMRKNREE